MMNLGPWSSVAAASGYELAMAGVCAAPVKMHFGGVSGSLVHVPPAVLRVLDELFVFRGPAEVGRMLASSPHLVALLVEARAHAQRIFGDSVGLVLEVVRDPEVDVGSPELFLHLQTRLPVAEAREKLTQLDEEWWLDAVPRAEGRLSIALEYV